MGEIFKEVCQDYNDELREFSGGIGSRSLIGGNFSFSKNFRFSEDSKISLLQKNPTRVQSTNSLLPMGKEVLDEKLLRDFCGRWSLDTSH